MRVFKLQFLKQFYFELRAYLDFLSQDSNPIVLGTNKILALISLVHLFHALLIFLQAFFHTQCLNLLGLL